MDFRDSLVTVGWALSLALQAMDNNTESISRVTEGVTILCSANSDSTSPPDHNHR